MSQNVINIIEGIFKKLINEVEEDDKDRIVSTKRYIIIDKSLVKDAFDVVAKASTRVIKTNDLVNIFTVSYQEERYVVLPEKYSQILEVIDLNEVDNDSIQQGIGILAMSSDCVSIKDGISSLEIINQCLELLPENEDGHVDFTYNQIIDLFESFIVAKIENSNFKVNYMEDFLRMYGIMLTIFPNNLLTDNTYEKLRELLFLESSRSIASSIINVMQSGMNEHKFLQLYQCIEYLFIIYNAIEISSKYSIDNSTAVEMIINEGFRVTEISNVVSIIGKCASESSIINFYDVIIQGEECDNKSERVSSYIYKIRCNVAHLRYKQEKLLESLYWKDLLEYATNMVLSIYQKMDNKISKLCTETYSWTSI